jgi:hypothetical protein
MTTRNDFSPEQWQAIRNAPQLVALATAAAGNSGLFGSLSEGMATASTIAEATRHEQPLLREIFAREEISGAQEGFLGFGGERVSDGEKKFLAQLECTIA